MPIDARGNHPELLEPPTPAALPTTPNGTNHPRLSVNVKGPWIPHPGTGGDNGRLHAATTCVTVRSARYPAKHSIREPIRNLAISDARPPEHYQAVTGACTLKTTSARTGHREVWQKKRPDTHACAVRVRGTVDQWQLRARWTDTHMSWIAARTHTASATHNAEFVDGARPCSHATSEDNSSAAIDQKTVRQGIGMCARM